MKRYIRCQDTITTSAISELSSYKNLPSMKYYVDDVIDELVSRNYDESQIQRQLFLAETYAKVTEIISKRTGICPEVTVFGITLPYLERTGYLQELRHDDDPMSKPAGYWEQLLVTRWIVHYKKALKYYYKQSMKVRGNAMLPSKYAEEVTVGGGSLRNIILPHDSATIADPELAKSYIEDVVEPTYKRSKT